jgi:hypothetical protein
LTATIALLALVVLGSAFGGDALAAARHARAHHKHGRVVCHAKQARARAQRSRYHAPAAGARCRESATPHKVNPYPRPGRHEVPAPSPGLPVAGHGAPTQSGGRATTPGSGAPSEAESGSGLAIGPSSGGLGWEGFGGAALPDAGWRPYSPSSPFNQSTEGDPVAANSAALVQAALAHGLPGNMVAGTAETGNDWSHPTFFAQPSDPLYTLHATEPWRKNELEGMRIPIPADAQPANGGDGHMTIVTPDGWEYDFWQATTPPPGGGTLSFSWGGRTRIDGAGTGSGGTAAGFGNLAGMIRAPELAAGKINHALFIVLKCAARDTSFGYGATASPSPSDSSYVYPATHGGSSCSSTEKNMPPLGARFKLAMSSAEIQALSVPAWKKTILTALSQYGGYVGDTGGPGFAFMFESSTSYTALGLADPLVSFAGKLGLPKWEGNFVFNMASGVEWSKYLQVLAPPSAS